MALAPTTITASARGTVEFFALNRTAAYDVASTTTSCRTTTAAARAPRATSRGRLAEAPKKQLKGWRKEDLLELSTDLAHQDGHVRVASSSRASLRQQRQQLARDRSGAEQTGTLGTCPPSPRGLSLQPKVRGLAAQLNLCGIKNERRASLRRQRRTSTSRTTTAARARGARRFLTEDRELRRQLTRSCLPRRPARRPCVNMTTAAERASQMTTTVKWRGRTQEGDRHIGNMARKNLRRGSSYRIDRSMSLFIPSITMLGEGCMYRSNLSYGIVAFGHVDVDRRRSCASSPMYVMIRVRMVHEETTRQPGAEEASTVE